MTTATNETETRPLAELKVREAGNVRATLDGVDALAESIRLVGVLVPVAIEPDGTIVAGHRRYAAALKAGLAEIPVRVISDVEAAAGTTGAASTAFAALENIAREQLSPDEEATAIERMLDAGYTPDGAAQILAMPLARVTRRAQLLKLPPELRAHYRSGGNGPLSILPLLVTISDAQPWLAKAIAKFDLRDLTGSRAGEELDSIISYCRGNVNSWERDRVPKGLPKPPAGFVWVARNDVIRPSDFAGAKLPADLKTRLEKATGNYEWSARRAWKTRRAALRGLWWWLVRRYPNELCQDCGRPVGRSIGTYWHASDELYERVRGTLHGTVCPGCFTEAAEERGVFIYWSPQVRS